jgi:hypothetical protein
MFKRGMRILLLVSLLSLATFRAAYAQGDDPGGQFRRVGVISSIDLPGKTFTLRTLIGGDVHVHVTGATEFRSPGGEILRFDDLEEGMRAQVVGDERGDGTIQATRISVARAEDLPPTMRLTGKIDSVALESFVLLARDGRNLTFHVIDRTTFRSRDGSIQSLGDLQPRMDALVVGVEQDGQWNALLVAAGNLDNLKERAFRAQGEITAVVPGQNTFTLETPEGESISFLVGERTRFRSPDGTVTSIHELKKGMVALVAAVESEENGNLALLVAAGYPPERPEKPVIDVRAAGRISQLGSNSVTIEDRDGGTKTFLVDGNTVFRSRDGSVGSYDDLEPGMIALIRGSKLDNGSLLARWIGAAQPTSRPAVSGSEDLRPAQIVE